MRLLRESDSLEKNNLTARVKQILHRVNSLICTPKNSNLLRFDSRLDLENKFFPNKRSETESPTYTAFIFIRFIHSLSNHFVGEISET